MLQVGSQSEMPVGLSLESSYLIVETPVNRDAVAVEFLRRSRIKHKWQLIRTDLPGWQISLADIPVSWRPQVRQAGIASSPILFVSVFVLCAMLLLAVWFARQ